MSDVRGANGASLDTRVLPLEQDATFKLRKGAVTVDGSFITEVHVVAETGRKEGELVHAVFWANELNDFNTGKNMITGFCGKRPFFLGPMKSFSCGNLVIQVKHSSATFTTPEWQSTVRGNFVYDNLAGPTHRLDVSLRAVGSGMVAPGQTHGAAPLRSAPPPRPPLLTPGPVCVPCRPSRTELLHARASQRQARRLPTVGALPD